MSDQSLRDHVLYLLNGGGAHLDFEHAVQGLAPELRGATISNVPHSAWQQVEHMRICQWDILEFSVNPNHVSPEFPEGYWPSTPTPPHETAWDDAVDAFRSDLEAMCRLVRDPRTDLFAEIPHGDGQTILREALLIADHNAYHLGQLIVLRKALGAWPAD